jgi:hypothetical protein
MYDIKNNDTATGLFLPFRGVMEMGKGADLAHVPFLR